MSRRATVMLMLVSGAAAVASAVPLAQRLVAFYKEHPPSLFAFRDLETRHFSFSNRVVNLEDHRDARGELYLDVQYGNDRLPPLRVSIPPRQESLLAHGLAGHADWMKVSEFVEFTGRSLEDVRADMDAGRIPKRLALVTRSPRPGVDPQTWGQVWFKDWSFDFYEFLPEGGFRHQMLRYPTTKQFQATAAGEIEEGTWQFQAALRTMPTMQASPPLKFKKSGFTAMGWTFPATCLSTFVFMMSMILSVKIKGERTPRAMPSPT